MGVGEPVGQPRLAHPGLAHDRDDLPPTGAGLPQDPAEVLDLGVAADEAGEAPEDSGLESRPGLSRPRQLEDVDGARGGP
jgi:hypothetical protein